MDSFDNTNSSENIVTVYGVNDAVGGLIVKHLTKYAITQVFSGLKEVIVNISGVGIDIEYAVANYRMDSVAKYKIQIREDLALRFSRAIDRAENNPYLREEIKRALMKELEKDLYDMWKQVDSDFQRRLK